MKLKQPKTQENQESQEPSIETQINTQIEAQIKAEIQQVLTSNPSNSCSSTSYSAPPPLDLKTLEIQIVLLLQITFKTPSNLAKLNKLKELFVQSQINQNLLFEKAIKAV